MAKGLDIGTAIFIEASQNESEEESKERAVALRKVRNAYLTFPASEEETLTMAGVKYNRLGDNLLIIGNDAMELAATFERELSRPFDSGIIDMQSEQTHSVIRSILKNIPGPTENKGEIMFFSVPAKPLDSQYNAWDFHRAFFKQELESLGYEADSINEAVSVGYAELKEHGYTGICFSFGAGRTNVCYLNRGMEVFSFSCALGGDTIDKEAARVMGTSSSHITVLKEKGIDLNKGAFVDNTLNESVNARVRQEVEAICTVYKDMIDRIVKILVDQIKQPEHYKLILDKLPVVLAGGTSKPDGFAEIVLDCMKKNSFPYPIGEVIIPEDSLMSVSKGCLLRAALKEQIREKSGVAYNLEL